jgi:Uma2 family endonuclease
MPEATPMGHVLYDHLTRQQFLRLPPTQPPLEFVHGEVVRPQDGPVIFEGLTLAQFLRLPEAKPALEYIDGKVVQKASPNRTHSVLHTMLSSRLLEHARPRKLGLPYIALRSTFDGRALVPDLSFFARGRIPKDAKGKRVDDIFLAPDLAIEIISPGQTVKNLSARLTWCVAHGVRLGWLIQSTRDRVLIFRPDQPVEAVERDGLLSGEAVLPGFALPLVEMFGWLLED